MAVGSKTKNPLEHRNLLPEDLKPITSLEDYKASGGLKGLERARTMTSEELIAEIKKSGLRGRGGAGFPAAIKWQTVYEDESPHKYVVCNFAEGEPGTFKDRYLASKNPYIILEGMLICAHAIKATQSIVGTKEKFKDIVLLLKGAIKEFEDGGVCESGDLKLVLGPDEYLFGEEKALLEVIDGRDPMPRLFPPYMVGVGYTPNESNPTVVNNAESMSHLTKIMANGAEWFAGLGSDDTHGTIIITLSGDVKTPGMYEVETGLTVRQMLYDLGGGPKKDREFKAVFSGVSNRVLTPDKFDLAMDFGTLRNEGVGLGSCGFMVYDSSRSMLQVCWMFSHFLAKSSCGQCIPCNMGTRVITEHLANVYNGIGTQEDLDAIATETGRCTNQTRCFLPVQESVVIPSIIKAFPEEFDGTVDKSQFDLNIPVPKIQSFNEDKHEFIYESNPKEFSEA